MHGEPGMGPNVVQKPFVRPAQSFKRWRNPARGVDLAPICNRSKKKTVAALLAKTLVLAGVIRILGVAGDSLISIIDTVRASKDITWVPLRHKDVGAFAAGAKAHLAKSFTLRRQVPE
jgi:Thiamine pyrophosphate enzyme, N-terminal TPP binding domain